MKRRGFLVSSLAASALASVTPSADATPPEAAPEGAGREYYELRRFQLRTGPQQQLTNDFFRDAAIPAMNRLGIKPVGAFTTDIGPGSPALYVLTPHPSAESVVTLLDRMAADPEFTRAGAPFLNVTGAEPAYVRVESSLFGAFAGMPKLELPRGTAENKPRIFELRTYESPSKQGNRTKIHMFNTGEIAIFRRTGLHPVFFGETLVGTGMPSLTYMLTFADMEERTRNWATFISDPEWKRFSSAPVYADSEIVSGITNLILSPTPYSQI